MQAENNKPAAPLAHIAELTGAKVRVFLTEVTEGVSSYRSMHSLTQQVEHQYHGRFLIELLQNAHDAFDEPSPISNNRVEIRFEPDDSPNGTLFVANDGQPFSTSNFERLSQLGQSDKDPQKSIGNKGIGFRSVLEISDCPEIYSRETRASPGFDGYCFAFRPDVVKSLVAPIEDLAKGDAIPTWSMTQEPIIENWSDEMLARFRQRTARHGMPWLLGELNFLSPYLLPVPLPSSEPIQVKTFEECGFATVVRLPLKSADLREYVLKQMAQLTGATLLFLEKISELRIAGDGGEPRVFTRGATRMEGGLGGSRILIGELSGEGREYGLWKKALLVSEAPEEFRNAVAKLPGRWPEITDISVTVAVPLGGKPEAGKFSIYLPTLVPTGSAAYVNAPFFGDMSRTSIPFEDGYNHHLLETAADLAVDVVRNELAGKGEIEACAIIDFLAPLGTSPAAKRWSELVDEAARRASAHLESEALALAENGWRALDKASLVPTPPKIKLLTEDVLRRNATFDIFHRCLGSRVEQVKRLAEHMFGEVGAYPTHESIASTIAKAASEMRATGGDWNEFWRDVMLLLPTGQAELSKHAVLLGGDGALHRASAGKKVFFVPKQGTPDDGDIDGDSTTTGVPSTLRASVAFLSDQIQVYDPKRPALQTPVRGYLGTNNLVLTFRIETIFAEVLNKRVPALPLPIEGKHFSLCRDILGWAIRLIDNAIARGRATATTYTLLKNIPVPCEGGWYLLQQVCVGKGWPATVGDVLSSYLEHLASDAARETRKRLLLPPDHPAWGSVAPTDLAILLNGGVQNGLPLFQVKSSEWQSKFEASEYSFRLPPAPAAIPEEQWSKFFEFACGDVRIPFTRPHVYEVGSIAYFPGMFEYQTLPEKMRQEASALIIQSLSNWEARKELRGLTFSKQHGVDHHFEVSSPLMHFLKTVPWMAIRDNKSVNWARPMERWHVPADALAGRARHFAHLKALPVDLAREIGRRPDLETLLKKLGMHFFDPHSTTHDPALLEALNTAVGGEDVADMNVLLGQIRDAWQRFRPEADHPPIMPLAVRRQNRRLSTIVPSVESPAYLPDSAAYVTELEELNFPVVAIRTSDARELREWFASAYGEQVQLTSKLSLLPYVSDQKWTGSKAVALVDSDLGWLIRPLLVMVSTQGRGIHSEAFRNQVATLQSARVEWVPNLNVAVIHNEAQLALTEVSALWEPKQKTLVVSEHCRTHVSELSGALAQALERDDLELPLRYVLNSLRSSEEAPDDIAAFLAPLRISTEQVHQVLEHLRGDIGHMSRLIALLLGVIAKDSVPLDWQAVTTEEELSDALQQAAFRGLDAVRTLQLARDSQDLFDFGRSVSRGLGDIASLARWNDALVKAGQPVLVNRNWQLELQANLEEAAALAKRIAAHAIRKHPSLKYVDMWAEYRKLDTSVDLSGSHWTVTYNEAMNQLANLAGTWLDESELIISVRGSSSNDELRSNLVTAGVLVDTDPDECGRKNHEQVEALARKLDRLRLAVWLRNTATLADDDSPKPLKDQYEAAMAGELAGDAFARQWTEAEVFVLMKRALAGNQIPEFQRVLEASSNLQELKASLQVTDEELEDVENRLEVVRAKQQRSRNVANVCGEEFDSSEDNLRTLWAFLSKHIPDAELSKSMAFDLGKPASLVPTKDREPGKKEVKGPDKKPVRQTKAVDELVGLAGEMHVYRMLVNKYGEEGVPASAWVSENSKKVFPFNQGDDAMGCDFSFTVKGKQFRIEVKATSGEDESFKLGSSEIRLAMKIGSKQRRLNEVFLIVHVKNALSGQPSAVVLPNPYDPRCNSGFRIEEADARVRYHTSKKRN